MHDKTCFNCDEVGHVTTICPHPKKEEANDESEDDKEKAATPKKKAAKDKADAEAKAVAEKAAKDKADADAKAEAERKKAEEAAAAAKLNEARAKSAEVPKPVPVTPPKWKKNQYTDMGYLKQRGLKAGKPKRGRGRVGSTRRAGY
jgi:hypothetical protein